MIPMNLDGESGWFITDAEYAKLTKAVHIARGQVWRRKGCSDSYICILAVDELAEVAVDQIVNSPSDPTPKYSGSGGGVGYPRTFKDIRTKYEYVANT